MAVVGCEGVTELSFDRADKPHAVFVTGDNLIERLLRGLKRAKVEPQRDVYVVGHCNWPRPIGLGQGGTILVRPSGDRPIPGILSFEHALFSRARRWVKNPT